MLLRNRHALILIETSESIGDLSVLDGNSHHLSPLILDHLKRTSNTTIYNPHKRFLRDRRASKLDA